MPFKMSFEFSWESSTYSPTPSSIVLPPLWTRWSARGAKSVATEEMVLSKFWPWHPVGDVHAGLEELMTCRIPPDVMPSMWAVDCVCTDSAGHTKALTVTEGPCCGTVMWDTRLVVAVDAF